MLFWKSGTDDEIMHDGIQFMTRSQHIYLILILTLILSVPNSFLKILHIPKNVFAAVWGLAVKYNIKKVYERCYWQCSFLVLTQEGSNDL